MRALLATAWVLTAVGVTLGAQLRVLEPLPGLDLYMPVPEGNPLTEERVETGRRLFFDTRLSADETLACASCHDPELAFSDGRAVPRGMNGVRGVRSAPALLNRGYGDFFFWDGRAASLEEQVLQPVFNPNELALSPAELERRTGMNIDEVASALAGYVRTIRSGNSRFDRYAAGQKGALGELEKQGLQLFYGKARCFHCHAGPNFTDELFHNTGVAWREDGFQDAGRFAVTGHSEDGGAFKTPTLREIGRTAPYMHDGSLPTLDVVVDFYSAGGRENPRLDGKIESLDLTDGEKRALVAFLQSLSGEVRTGLSQPVGPRPDAETKGVRK